MEALTPSSDNYRFPDHTASQRKKEKTCKLYRHPHRHTKIFGSHSKPAEIFFIWGKKSRKIRGCEREICYIFPLLRLSGEQCLSKMFSIMAHVIFETFGVRDGFATVTVEL